MPMRKALLIANTKYKNLDDLSITKNDVLSLETLLNDKNYGNFDVVTLVIDQEDIKKINIEIFNFYHNCKRDDFLLFYYSGHGILAKYSELYIAMNDYQEGREPTTAYPIYNICNYIKRYSKAKAKAVILDCCYSGAIKESLVSTSMSSNSLNINSYFLGTGTSILTSSRYYQLSFLEKDSLNSKFTKLMIEGIKTGKADYSKDGIIDFKELHRYISENIDEQNPQLFENSEGSLYISQNPNIFQKKYIRPYNNNFVYIKGGKFEMGSPYSELDRYNEELLHTVKLDDFYIGKYLVTVKEFNTFIKKTSYELKHGDIYDNYNKKDNHPVVYVSWDDANNYCKWLNKIYNGTYRLPTEAEWEYVCRAGTNTTFYTGNNLTTNQANYDGNYPYNDNPKGTYMRTTTKVGNYLPNKWGLYDMCGNVWEWCEDLYDDNYYRKCTSKGISKNPINQEKGSYRSLRGGSWRREAKYCRSAFRNYYPGYSTNEIGFRVVFVP